MGKKQKAEPQTEFNVAAYKDFSVPLWNDEQKAAWEVISRNDLVFLSGPAGTAKTFVSMAFGISAVLSGRVRNIVVGRPAIEAYEDLGYLPGTEEEKIAPFLQPIFDAIDRVTTGDSDLKRFVRGRVKATGLAYLRGRTFWDSVVIVDEAQNLRLGQLKMIISRLGKGSKLIFAGDATQHDIPKRDCRYREAAESLSNSRLRRFGWYEFTTAAIVRHPIISDVIKCLETMEENG